MTVITTIPCPSSCSRTLHAVALSCYNNTLWLGASNCSLWRMEVPVVPEVDVSRDSLADLHVKPLVTCELWSGVLICVCVYVCVCMCVCVCVCVFTIGICNIDAGACTQQQLHTSE